MPVHILEPASISYEFPAQREEREHVRLKIVGLINKRKTRLSGFSPKGLLNFKQTREDSSPRRDTQWISFVEGSLSPRSGGTIAQTSVEISLKKISGHALLPKARSSFLRSPLSPRNNFPPPPLLSGFKIQPIKHFRRMPLRADEQFRQREEIRETR